MTDASEEDEMAVEDEERIELTVDDDADDVELHAATDADDDDVEAHVWRAQS
jgi:hypothetical protein